MAANFPEISIDELKGTGKNAIAMGPFGSRIKAENFVKSGIPIIKGGNLNGDFILEDAFDFLTEEKATELISSNAFRGDIVITHRGTIGQVGIIPDDSKYERYVVSQSQLKVSLNREKVNPYFIYYFLRSPIGQHRLLMNASQVGVPAIAKASTSVKDILVPFPDKKIQDKIVNTLLNLDRKIILNTKTNETLEQLAKAIFKSWFVDFDPVKAKAQLKSKLETDGGDWDAGLIEIAEELGLSKDVLALFPDEFEESEFGLIPKGWESKPFGEFLINTIGGDWGKELPDNKHTEEVKILRGTDLPKVYRGDDSGVPIRYVEAKKLKTRVIEDGDIVIEISGGSKDQPTGRSLYFTQKLIDRLGYKLEPASFCRLFKPTNKKIGMYLGLHLMKIYDDGKTWQYQNQSTGISNFQTTIFLEKEIVVMPDNKVIDAFYRLVLPMILKIHSNQNQTLAKLRDTLLPKLLSGEITIEPAIELVESAA